MDRLAPGLQTLDAALYEVIVSDDGVPTVEGLISEKYPWVKWVAGPQRGPAANRNSGAKAAEGEWLVFTDDDCLPQSCWLEAYASNRKFHDLLEGRTSAIGTPTRFDVECPINETGGNLWSCNFAINRGKFEDLNGFNEGFPSPAMEDVELNTRVNKAFLVRRFIPTAQVLHPWRRRQGLNYVTEQAASVAHYVNLHPEQAAKFSFPSVILTLIRTTKRNIAHALATGRFVGLSRQIYIDACSGFLNWREVARRSQRNAE